MRLTRLLLILAMTALAACGGPVRVDIGEEETSRTVEVAPGREFEIAVETNASIGWTWEVTGDPDPDVAVFVGKEHDADSPEATGSGGTDRFRFRAVRPGETTIEMERDFRGEGPDRELTVSVVVAEG